jgi:hypothetical protein
VCWEFLNLLPLGVLVGNLVPLIKRGGFVLKFFIYYRDGQTDMICFES